MCTGELIIGRKNHTATLIGSQMIVFGGFSRYNNSLLNDF